MQAFNLLWCFEAVAFSEFIILLIIYINVFLLKSGCLQSRLGEVLSYGGVLNLIIELEHIYMNKKLQ